jgi:hypothetical protein
MPHGGDAFLRVVHELRFPVRRQQHFDMRSHSLSGALSFVAIFERAAIHLPRGPFAVEHNSRHVIPPPNIRTQRHSATSTPTREPNHAGSLLVDFSSEDVTILKYWVRSCRRKFVAVNRQAATRGAGCTCRATLSQLRSHISSPCSASSSDRSAQPNEHHVILNTAPWRSKTRQQFTAGQSSRSPQPQDELPDQSASSTVLPPNT